MKKTFRNWLKLGTAMMAAIVMLAACGANGSEGKVLNVARSVVPDTINYLINEAAENSQIIGNFSEGLTTYDKEHKLSPGLAQSWQHEDNVYTFTLRDNLKWSNGTPLTANDFVFGWTTLATLKAAPYSFFMDDLQNGEAVRKGEKPAAELGVKALDDKTLEVTLVQDRAYFLEMLAHTTFLPLNEAFYNEVGPEQYGTSADAVISSGAFKITDFNPAAEYVLVKNENYWNAANVQLDRINTKVIKESSTQDALFGNDELDVLDVTSTLAPKYPGDSGIVSIPTARIYYFYISGSTGTPSAAFSNNDFRQAVRHAIDKEVLATNVFKDGTVPLDYLVPTNFGDVNGKSYREATGVGADKQYIFDVAKAQEFLEKAKGALTPEDLNIRIAYRDKEEDKPVFENIQSQLQTNLPGVNVTLDLIPSQTYFKGLAEGNTPSAYAGWAPDYEDVATYFQNFIAGNSMNFGNHTDAEFDALFIQAQNELDPLKRAELFKQAEMRLIEEGMLIPIAQRGHRFAIKDNVKGFNFNSVSPEIDFRYISVD